MTKKQSKLLEEWLRKDRPTSEKETGKPVTNSEKKQTKTEKLAEMFGGTKKQKKQREEIEEVRMEELEKKRVGNVRKI